MRGGKPCLAFHLPSIHGCGCFRIWLVSSEKLEESSPPPRVPSSLVVCGETHVGTALLLRSFTTAAPTYSGVGVGRCLLFLVVLHLFEPSSFSQPTVSGIRAYV